jgi:hypothetical protein
MNPFDVMFGTKYPDDNYHKLYDYPNPEEINPTLIKVIEESVSSQALGDSRRTTWCLFLEKRHEVKEIDLLLSWVEEKCALFSRNYSTITSPFNMNDEEMYVENVRKGLEPPTNAGGGGEGSFNPFGFVIGECWGMSYGKGSGVATHSHYPWPIAFVYYVNTPEGSAPIRLGFANDYEEINPTAGQLLFLDGHTKHGVPTNIGKVSGRMSIAGLFTYIPKNLK